jgi:NAD(P)-dependent dehydrogenase (short-subunit alcohol dehydrogenase family)
VKPLPPPKPEIIVVPLSSIEKLQNWFSRNKYLIGATIVVTSAIAYKGYQQNKYVRKVRRAKRSKNGGRSEVIVIAGSPRLPLTKTLALDMERRGFIVFIVCNATEDEAAVKSFSRPDIMPLTIDTTNVSFFAPSPKNPFYSPICCVSRKMKDTLADSYQPPNAGLAIERFAHFLTSPRAPGPNIKPNHLTLKSVFLIPSLHYQTSPIATIPPSAFADLFNTHLLQPILTIQTFLPLLTSRLGPIGEKWVPPKVLVFTPSIISSINPPFHAPEATVCSALSAFTEVLTAELRPLDIPVTHMQLGTFDFSGFVPIRTGSPTQGLVTSAGNPEDTLIWPDGARHVYGRNFVAQTASAISGARIRGLKGSSLRHLHATVFDVIDGSVKSDTVRIGLGASIYGFVGRWAPRSIVSWMMGIRKVDELSTWKTSSYEGSEDGSDDEGAEGSISESKEFIAVQSEGNVWNSGETAKWEEPAPEATAP